MRKLGLSVLFILSWVFCNAQTYINQSPITINGIACTLHYNGDASVKHPLIVMFQGAGQYGTDPTKALTHGTGWAIQNGKWNPDSTFNFKTSQYESYIVLSTVNIAQNTTPSFSAIDGLYTYMRNNYPVDSNAMYITGLSAGGGPATYFGAHISGSNCCPASYSFTNPKNLLAAQIPMSAEILDSASGVTQPVQFEVADSIPVWGWADSNDCQGHGLPLKHWVAHVNRLAPSLGSLFTQFHNNQQCHGGWDSIYTATTRQLISGHSMNIYEWALFHRRGAAPLPPVQTITIGSIAQPSFCVTTTTPATFSVTFTTTGSFNAGNTFNVQMSDATGSFASFKNVGLNTVSPISVTIPANTLTGTNYKFRIQSTNPTVTSNSSATKTINLASGNVTPSASQTISVNVNGNLLTANTTSTPTSVQWYDGASAITGATSLTYLPKYTTPGSHSITCHLVFPCATITTNAVSITAVVASPAKIYITPVGGGANIIGCNGSFKYNPGDTLVFRAIINGVPVVWNRIYLHCINNVTLINEGAVQQGDYYGGSTTVQTVGGFVFDNCTHIHLTGTGIAGVQYGFTDSSNAKRGVGVQVLGISNFIEVDHLKILKRNAGFWVKEEQLDNQCYDSLAFPNLVIHDIYLHDNFIYGVVNEGMYLGSTAPNSNDTSINNQHPITYCPNGDTNHTLTARLGNIRVYNNTIDSTGRGGIQLASADSGQNLIYGNHVTRSGYSGTYGQGNGIVIGGYTHADIHDNYVSSTVGASIFSLGSGLVRIYNNTIDSSGIIQDGTLIPNAPNIEIDTRNTSNPSPGHANPELLTFQVFDNTVGAKTSTYNIVLDKTYNTFAPTGSYICRSGSSIYNGNNVPYSTNCGAPSSITIGSGIPASPICLTNTTGVSFSLLLTSVGTFNTGNQYSAQLSNKNGSFASPTIIGTTPSVSNSASISCIIPQGTTSGTNYRIRIISTAPVLTSDTSVAITINLASNGILPSAQQDILTNTNGNVLSVTEGSTPTSRQWYSNGIAISGQTATTYTPLFATAGTFNITCRSIFTCSTIISNTVVVVVTAPITPTITTGSVSSPICVLTSTPVSVTWTSVGVYNADNIYIAQLSNKNGSFASITTIGTLPSNANSGTINATISNTVLTGTAYRIRVVSTSPVVTGTNNGSNIIINQAVNSIAPITTQNILTNANGAKLTVTELSTALSRLWYVNNVSTGISTTTYIPNFSAAGTYLITCKSTFSCGVSTSNTDTVNVSVPPPPPSITTAAVSPLSYCITSANPATISVSFTSIGTYASTNVYSLQLSNSTASFSSPTIIGVLPSSGNSGTIIGTIPTTTPAGNRYRVRVVSNSPTIIGSNNGTNISIVLGADTISPVADQAIFTNASGNILTVKETISPISRAWYYGTIPGVYNTAIGNTTTTYTPSFNVAGIYYVVCKSVFTCGTAVSDSVKIVVTDAPPPPPLSISTGSVTGFPICVPPTTSVSVPFTITGTPPTSGNTYTAQLSAPNGSFASATAIGFITSVATSGSISSTIPANTVTGIHYRIRVVASTPATIGTDNGIDLVVNLASNSITPSATQSIFTNTDGNTLTVAETSTTISRLWYVNGASTGITTITYTPNFSLQGTYTIVCKSTFSCGVATSNAITVNATDAPPTTIATGLITGSPICVPPTGASVSVPFTGNSGVFNANNVFTAQLSNNAGSFASPVNIGTLPSTNISGTISAIIPSVPTGLGYRIRVVSSNPVITGADNGVDVSINLAANSISPIATQNILTNANGSALSVTEELTVVNRLWYANGVSTGVTSTTYTPNFGTAGTYNITCRSTFPCGVVTSNSVAIIVTDPPPPSSITTGVISGSPICVKPTPPTTVSISFTSVGSYAADNQYKAKLSDKNGSFAINVNLGTITSNANSGVIIGTIPIGTLTGTGYRIRVVSTNPVVTGANNGVNITINQASNSVSPPDSQFIEQSISGNTLSVTEGSTPVSRQWYANSTLILGATSTTYTPNFAVIGVYNVTCHSTFACGEVVSNAVPITVTPTPLPPPDTICSIQQTAPRDTIVVKTFSRVVSVPVVKDTTICKYYRFLWLILSKECTIIHDTITYHDSTEFYDSSVHQTIAPHDTLVCIIVADISHNNSDLAIRENREDTYEQRLFTDKLRKYVFLL